MSRPLHVWVAFFLCLAVLVAVVGWISWTTLELERREAHAQDRAELEDTVRLALWRMDSSAASLLAQESARPYFVYSSYYPAQRAYTRMFATIEPGEVMVASPLLAEELPHVLLHFQLDPAGALASPQVPAQAGPDVAPGRLAAMRERLERLRGFVRADELRSRFPPSADVPEGELPRTPEPPLEQLSSRTTQNALRKSSNEWRARALNVQSQVYTKNVMMPQQLQVPLAADDADGLFPDQGGTPARPMREVKTATVAEGPVRPLWMGGELLLARGVSLGGRRYVQGCWLDWKGLAAGLTKSVADLLPAARLEPVGAGDAARAHDNRRLAALPAILLPGQVPAPPRDSSPIRWTLLAAWVSAGLAAVAVGALLLGVLTLSERRAAFVSAVTHELRTPLTTFRLYTDMLAGGVVTDPVKRTKYLETLKREAERLGHLVENVLAYARLEKGRSGRRLEPIALSELIEKCRGRLDERSKAAGFQLEVELPADLSGRILVTDASAVDQVLFNLVDNACKYAAAAADRRIRLGAALADRGRRLLLTVRDAGPGISRGEARGLFVPFSRSAQQAAGNAPGVGLGLALSRQLARQLGGDLELTDERGPGAVFAFRLPLA